MRHRNFQLDLTDSSVKRAVIPAVKLSEFHDD